MIKTHHDSINKCHPYYAYRLLTILDTRVMIAFRESGGYGRRIHESQKNIKENFTVSVLFKKKGNQL